jgi:hypothetical protein
MRLTLTLASAAVFTGVPSPAVARGQSPLPSTEGEAGVAATAGEETLKGTLVWEVEGQAPGDFYGVALAPAGDVNVDGFPDLVVGAYGYLQTFPFQALEGRRESRPGYATVVSGSDGRVLHTLSDDDSDLAYGMAVGAAGDIDADGCADIVVGAPNLGLELFALFGRKRGRAYVYSGRTGALITVLSSKLGGAAFGGSVGGLGDLDGDGYPEIGIGGQDDDADRGVLIVYSSKEWKPRLTLEGGSWAFGGSFCAIDDINGDGVRDIAVGDRLADTPEDRDTGSVGLFCGSTGALLRSWHGPAKFASLGSAVAPACDLDGDGLRDLLVGAKGSETAGSNAGGAFLHSTSTGRPLLSVFGPRAGMEAGSHLTDLGDLDGDGVCEFAVAAYRESSDPPVTGKTRVYSGRTGAEVFSTDGITNAYLEGGAGPRSDLLVVGRWPIDPPGHAEENAVVQAYRLERR